MAVPPQSSQLDAALQQAFAHHRAGRLPEAEQLYRSVLQAVPNHPDINNALGVALKGQGKSDAAAAVFQQLAKIAPNYAPGHSNFGNVLFEQGRLSEAEASYRQALALRPDMPDALKNLGLAIVDSGRFEESVPLFRRHAELTYARAVGAAPSPHRAQHDREQRDYLGNAGSGPTPFHLEAGERVAGRAVNLDSSGGKIAARWETSSPQVAVIDNLLTEEALERLRQYCWRSTIWLTSYPNGYLAAMPEHGFACPLLVQIADELRNTYPAIVGDNHLLRWWGFKYDSKLSGINIHADFAAVNVNFWIAPDEANLDPQSGGLVIWDKPAPIEWSIAEYNSPNANRTIRDFLAQSGATSVTVPHRANRAVIFDSDLFHETDKIVFKEGYTNRRINITMLFGTRESAAKRGHDH